MWRGLEDHVRDAVHRRADYDEVRRRHPIGEVSGERVDGAALDGEGEVLRIAATTDYAGGHPACLRGQSDRPADESDSDDRDLLEPHAGNYKGRRGKKPLALPLRDQR